MPSGGQPSTILVDRPAACAGMERDGDIIIRSRTSEKRSYPTVGSFRCEQSRTRRQPARRSPEEARRRPEEARKKPTRVNDRARNVLCRVVCLCIAGLCILCSLSSESCIWMLAAAGLTSPFSSTPFSLDRYTTVEYPLVLRRLQLFHRSSPAVSLAVSLSLPPILRTGLSHSNGRHAVGR